MGTLNVFLLVILLTSCVCEEFDIETQVSNEDGVTTFVGTASNVDNYNRAMFRGIRYGTPPIGDNRFKKSTFYKYKTPKVVAKTHGSICPQEINALIVATDPQSEDCLFLNVFVPLDNFNATTGKNNNLSSHIENKRAVYVFIHGGAFVHGSSNLYDTARFTTQGDIIVVALNYRLGVLGFLTSDDDVIPANLGLWDQQLAIQWVYNHIESFGGDKDRITVGGQSAGAISSVLQSFYKGNDKLFQNTIAESGTPLALRFVYEKGLSLALVAAKLSGCQQYHAENTTSSEIRQCLLNVPPVMFHNMTFPLGLMMSPVYDNDFISKETFKFFPQTVNQFVVPSSIPSTFANKNFLTGFVSEEGEVVYKIALESLAANLDIGNVDEFKAVPIGAGMFKFLVANQILQNTEVAGNGIVTDAIMNHYIDWSRPLTPTAISQAFVDFGSDVYFHVPTLNTAHLHSIGCNQFQNSTTCNKTPGKTFVYEFTLPLTATALTREDALPWFKGTRHGIELLFLSDRTQISSLIPNLEDFMITAWSNFIKTGDPNNNTQKQTWKEYTATSKDMFWISDSQKPITQSDLDRSAHFWNEYIPGLISRVKSTFAVEPTSQKESLSGVGKATSLELERSTAILSCVVSFIFVCRRLL